MFITLACCLKKLNTTVAIKSLYIINMLDPGCALNRVSEIITKL